MESNKGGFSLVETLVVLAVVALVVGVGWRVYDSRNSNAVVVGDADSQTEMLNQEIERNEQKTNVYLFEELGISMDIIEGWGVKENHTKSPEGDNLYSWTVEKTGEDGKIGLDSRAFRGGFTGCEFEDETLTKATIHDVAPSNNEGLTFMSWSYKNQDETIFETGIVAAEQAVFRKKNDFSAPAIVNEDIAPGSYFFCLSSPHAGFSLSLNEEAISGASRRDTIYALSSKSSNSNFTQLPFSAESYDEIKTMLTSIE